MRSYVQKGEALDLIAPAGGVVSGVGYFIGAFFVIASLTADEGDIFAGHRLGVFDLAAATDGGGAQAMNAGDPVYWDDADKVCTVTAAGNKMIGVATEAKLSTAATARVCLVPRLAAAANAIANLGGALTGATDGNLADTAHIALATAGGNTYSDAAVNTAVNAAIDSVNEQIKEVQAKINAILAALRGEGEVVA